MERDVQSLLHSNRRQRGPKHYYLKLVWTFWHIVSNRDVDIGVADISGGVLCTTGSIGCMTELRLCKN